MEEGQNCLGFSSWSVRGSTIQNGAELETRELFQPKLIKKQLNQNHSASARSSSGCSRTHS